MDVTNPTSPHNKGRDHSSDPSDGCAAAPRHDAQRSRRNDSPWSAVGMITQLGLVVSLCIVGSVMAGVYIDRLVGSNGLVTLIMIPVGLGAAAVAAWEIIKQELP